MSTADVKQILRLQLKEQRDTLGLHEYRCLDEIICQRVLNLLKLQQPDLLLTYLSIGSEVETRSIIQGAWDANVAVALPRCVMDTRELRWHRISSFDKLVKKSFGIKEPEPNSASEVIPSQFSAVALVPALAFDKNGYRLGYGGGFYDRFLAHFAGLSVGIVRDRQIVESFHSLGAIEAHDLPVHMIVTEKQIFHVDKTLPVSSLQSF